MVGHFVLIFRIISPHCPQTTLTTPSHFCTLLYTFAHFCTFSPHNIVQIVCGKAALLLLVPWPPFGCKQHLSYNRLLATHTLAIVMLPPYHTILYHTSYHTISYNTTQLTIPHSIPYQTYTCPCHAKFTPLYHNRPHFILLPDQTFRMKLTINCTFHHIQPSPTIRWLSFSVFFKRLELLFQ